jgi:hypothetical protein
MTFRNKIPMVVNGRPPSYARDLALLAIWRLRVWLYMAGALDRPPELRVRREDKDEDDSD